MRHIILAAALALGATAAAADPIEGVWQTQPDEGAFAHVTIAPCGGAFCGTCATTNYAARYERVFCFACDAAASPRRPDDAMDVR